MVLGTAGLSTQRIRCSPRCRPWTRRSVLNSEESVTLTSMKMIDSASGMLLSARCCDSFCRYLVLVETVDVVRHHREVTLLGCLGDELQRGLVEFDGGCP